MIIDDIELKEDNFYISYDAFVEAVKTYASKKGFQICLDKVKKNIVGNIHKRTLLCSCEDDPKKTSTEHNYAIVAENHQHFMSNEKEILSEIQEKILLLHYAGYMTTIQRGESIDNLMKGYIDATTLLTAFLKAFKNALEYNKENVEFIKYQENNFNNYIITKSLFEKQD
ncbi:15348_t:CDS:2, partial [Cetraspora pellucida]